MAFFSKNLYYIKFFSEMYYHVFSTKADQKGGSIHEKKNLFPEIHILKPTASILCKAGRWELVYQVRPLL